MELPGSPRHSQLPTQPLPVGPVRGANTTAGWLWQGLEGPGAGWQHGAKDKRQIWTKILGHRLTGTRRACGFAARRSLHVSPWDSETGFQGALGQLWLSRVFTWATAHGSCLHLYQPVGRPGWEDAEALGFWSREVLVHRVALGLGLLLPRSPHTKTEQRGAPRDRCKQVLESTADAYAIASTSRYGWMC